MKKVLAIVFVLLMVSFLCSMLYAYVTRTQSNWSVRAVFNRLSSIDDYYDAFGNLNENIKDIQKLVDMLNSVWEENENQSFTDILFGIFQTFYWLIAIVVGVAMLPLNLLWSFLTGVTFVIGFLHRFNKKIKGVLCYDKVARRFLYGRVFFVLSYRR